LQRISIQSAQTLYEKEAIFLAVGLNDSVFYDDTKYFMAEQEFKENLKKIIMQAKTFSRKVYVVGLTNVDESKVCPYPGSRTGKS
jgi:lysophospholipase L1-like esterase